MMMETKDINSSRLFTISGLVWDVFVLIQPDVMGSEHACKYSM